MTNLPVVSEFDNFLDENLNKYLKTLADHSRGPLAAYSFAHGALAMLYWLGDHPELAQQGYDSVRVLHEWLARGENN